MAGDDEGLSLKQKVAAGVAIGVATTAAAGAARKFMGGDSNDDQQNGQSDSGGKSRQGSKAKS